MTMEKSRSREEVGNDLTHLPPHPSSLLSLSSPLLFASSLVFSVVRFNFPRFASEPFNALQAAPLPTTFLPLPGYEQRSKDHDAVTTSAEKSTITRAPHRIDVPYIFAPDSSTTNVTLARERKVRNARARVSRFAKLPANLRGRII